MTHRTCSIDGCDRLVKARGWCTAHWKRWWRHGDPFAGGSAHHATPEAAFAARTRSVEGGCVLWTGSTDSAGYGQLLVSGRLMPAHRYAWERVSGPISKRMEVNHRCWNPACVNPAHLELVTRDQNGSYRAGAQVNSSSRVRNVYRLPSGRYWVQVKKGERKHYFGNYATLEEAARVAAEARAELFGEYAGRG